MGKFDKNKEFDRMLKGFPELKERKVEGYRCAFFGDLLIAGVAKKKGIFINLNEPYRSVLEGPPHAPVAGVENLQLFPPHFYQDDEGMWMMWVAKALEGDSGPDEEEKKPPKPVDVQKLEGKIFQAAKKVITQFAKKHKTPVNALVFDCNAAYAQVLLALNTPEHLESRVRKYSEKDRSQAETRKSLQFNAGDFLHQALDVSDSIPKWDRVSEYFEETGSDCGVAEDEGKKGAWKPMQKLEKDFLEMVCRVLYRLDSEGILKKLNRADDFDFMVADHDEPLSASVKRMKRVRGRIGKAAAPAKESKAKPKKSSGKDLGAGYFEFKSGSSEKFWEISLSGREHTVRYGRIGSAGQKKTKKFGSPADAKKDVEKLVASKVGKGYRRTRK